MSQSDDKLHAIGAQLKKGVAPPKETVRSFLLWFRSERRGYFLDDFPAVSREHAIKVLEKMKDAFLAQEYESAA